MDAFPPEPDPMFRVADHLVDQPSPDARPLAEHLATAGRLPVLHGLALAVQLLAVLDHAHATEGPHGAVSDRSVFVTRGGRIELCRAAACEPPGPPHAAPELLAGQPADVRSDVYAAGLLAYELIAGRAPFARPGMPPSWPARVARPDLPVAVDAVFRRALAQEPALRPPSAQALSAALQEAVGVPVWERAPARRVPARAAATTPAAAPRGPRVPQRRHALRAAWAAGLVTAAVAGFLLARPGVPVPQLPSRELALVEPAVPLVQTPRPEVPPLAVGPAPQVTQAPPPAPASQPRGTATARHAPPAHALAPSAPAAALVARAPAAVPAAARPAPPPPAVREPAREPVRVAAVPPRLAAREAAETRPQPPVAVATREPARRAARAERSDPVERVAVAVAPQCQQGLAIAQDLCLALRCALAEFRRHPVCVRFAARGEALRRDAGLREAQWSP
jgi:hypothetical protein